MEIIINVYYLGDSSDPNVQRLSTLANIGLGLHHTGVEINGIEYAYGGDPNNSGSGVF